MMQNITDLIAHPEKLGDKLVLHELREQIANYPYYSTLRILYLKGLYLTHDPAFGEELRHTALYISDRKALFYLIEGDYYTLKPAPRKPKIVSEESGETQEGDRTLTLIDAFLSGQPAGNEEHTLPHSNEGELSADYTTYILREEELDTPAQDQVPSHTPPMKGQHLIDNFIKKEDNTASDEPLDDEGPLPTSTIDELPSIEEEDGYFTETLAKIYIKQHRYSKALEIIKRLSLKYPKKNAYFADQISFLEKLIINSNEK